MKDTSKQSDKEKFKMYQKYILDIYSRYIYELL